MSGYYPAGVTGCEPEIIGTGLEDECQRCLAHAEGEIELDGEWLCIDCAQETASNFLDELRESGVTNMFGAAPYLEEEFSIARADAVVFLKTWMNNFK